MPEYKIESLPKWAQERIYTLERDLREANARFAAISGATDGRIMVSRLQERTIFLGDECVRFEVNEHKIPGFRRHWLEARILAKGEQYADALVIHADESIGVMPESSNAIRIWVPGF